MKGFGGGGGLQQLMRQANQMQSKMKKLQDELGTREYSGTAGGGGVTVKVNGQNRVLAVTIHQDVVTAGDVEMLQDLVVAAVNEALQAAKASHDEEMGKITGGMGLPGMF